MELARQQLEHGAHGLTVSTLVEAEVFARAGVTDLTWAFPIDPSHVAPARRIAEQTGATLRVVVDDQRTARVLAGSGLHVWLKVDCGNHRAGVNPASPYALKVASELGTEQGLVFDGILSHSGHAYRTTNKAEAARVAEQERSVMVGFAGRLREVGLEVRGVMGYEGHAVLIPDRAERAAKTGQAMERLAGVAEEVGGEIVSAGGTGTYDLNTAATEIQAGSYALMDGDYGKLGLPFTRALAITARLTNAAYPTSSPAVRLESASRMWFN